MLALGKVGKPNSGFGTLTGQGNGQGGREHGQKADQLPGYRLIEVDAHREAVAKVWGVDPASLPRKGKSAFELLDSLGERSAQPVRDGVERRGRGPALVAAHPEAEGTRTARRVRRLPERDVGTRARLPAGLPVGGRRRHDDQPRRPRDPAARRVAPADRACAATSTSCANSPIAPRLRREVRVPYDRSRVRRVPPRHRRRAPPTTAASPTRRSNDRTACSGRASPKTTRARRGCSRSASTTPTAARSSSRSNTAPPARSRTPSSRCSSRPGRYKEHYNSGAQTRPVTKLSNAKPIPRLEIHPRLARRHHVVTGSRVTVESRRAKVEFVAEVTADIRPDTLFAPFHWGGRHAANLLTSAALDPTSRMPEFKLAAVRIAGVKV